MSICGVVQGLLLREADDGEAFARRYEQLHVLPGRFGRLTSHRLLGPTTNPPPPTLATSGNTLGKL
jgi:hypothetical protein